MRLTAGLDEGPVCLVRRRSRSPRGHLRRPSPRVCEALSGELLVRALEEQPPFAEQSREGVTYAEKIGPADRLLDPARAGRRARAHRAGAAPAHRRAPGCSPGARRSASSRARLLDGGELAAGALAEDRDGRLLLGCSPGTLELLEVQPPGGRAMDAAAYLRGHPLT